VLSTALCSGACAGLFAQDAAPPAPRKPAGKPARVFTDEDLARYREERGRQEAGETPAEPASVPVSPVASTGSGRRGAGGLP
jgi:hypothetical protein